MGYLDKSESEGIRFLQTPPPPQWGPAPKPTKASTVKLYFSLTPYLFPAKHAVIVKSFIIKKIIDKQITKPLSNWALSYQVL